MENNHTLEQRIEIIERELDLLKSRLNVNSQNPWWEKVAGVFENDPAFEEISSLGRSIREQERANAPR
jgi:hypothetical protein